MRKKWLDRKGEGYIDICVGVIVFVTIIVITINIFSFITLRVEMDHIADELIDTATYLGCYGSEFTKRNDELQDEYYRYTVTTDADEYFNSYFRRVQLGHVMKVTVSVNTYIRGLGAFRIPVTLNVTRSGLSQKYWK